MTLTYDTEKTEVLIADPDDAVPESEWEPDGEKAAEFFFSTGRDWEPKETEDGVEIRTTPNPTVYVHEDGLVRIITIHAGPIVFRAFRTTEDPADFIERLTESIEEDFDGIERVEAESYDEEYNGVVRLVETMVDEFVEEA